MPSTNALLTLGQVADHFGLQAWKIRRLYERGLLPEPGRVGVYRTVAREDLPAVERALKQAGYLHEAQHV